MNIIDELKAAAEIADDSRIYISAISEIKRLKSALEDANGHCRAAREIACRRGENTNWNGFKISLEKSIEVNDRVLYKSIID